MQSVPQTEEKGPRKEAYYAFSGKKGCKTIAVDQMQGYVGKRRKPNHQGSRGVSKIWKQTGRIKVIATNTGKGPMLTECARRDDELQMRAETLQDRTVWTNFIPIVSLARQFSVIITPLFSALVLVSRLVPISVVPPGDSRM